MLNSLEKTEKWIKFHGKVLKETPYYIDLLATDGSEGQVRVFKGSYRRTGEGVEVLIGGRAKITKLPNKCCTNDDIANKPRAICQKINTCSKK